MFLSSDKMTKKEFCRIIRQLQAAEDLKKRIDDLIFTAVDVESDFMSGFGMSIDHAGLVVELLEVIMGDCDDIISWWCWEADFGRDKEMRMYINDEPIDLSTPELLYDYLLEDTNARADNE